jgi:hypothetical protein
MTTCPNCGCPNPGQDHHKYNPDFNGGCGNDYYADRDNRDYGHKPHTPYSANDSRDEERQLLRDMYARQDR